MKYWNNNQQKIHPRTTSSENQTPRQYRRLKTKPVLFIIAILLIGNILWFTLWITSINSNNNGGDEVVATVDGEKITRQEWMATMEALYGKETLHSLVNEEVMERAAKEYGIQVTNDEVNLEIALNSSAQDLDTSLKVFEEEQVRKKVRSQLILEKVLTKDILIEDKVIADYYEEHKTLYDTPTTYRTSVIIVNSEKEATQVQNELANGSDFSILARERSIDTASSSLGGNIGYIGQGKTNVDSEIQKAVQNLQVDEISNPFQLSDGNFALVCVTDIIVGKSFTLEDVSEHIKTELAMEQLPQGVSAEMFWKEFNVTSFYLK